MTEDNLKERRAGLGEAKRIVVKLGTGVLSDSSGALDEGQIVRIVSELVELREKNLEVILVSSGAVGAGVEALGMSGRPKQTRELQMAAAVGQVRLLKAYRENFSAAGVEIAQLLLTRDGLLDRRRYLNTRNTVLALLRAGVLPIVNENDVVSVEGLCFGDNDFLAACLAVLADADALVILSSVEGLLDGEGKVISHLGDIEDSLSLVDANLKSRFGLGGMGAKLEACEFAVRAGVNTLIASGRNAGVVGEILEGKEVGTFIAAQSDIQKGERKKWISFFPDAEGEVLVDSGAAKALVEKHVSLLPVGVKGVKGDFDRGALVEVKTVSGELLARGLSSCSSSVIEQVKGLSSDEIAVLKDVNFEELINRDNLIVLKNGGS